jgi:hypothetical protein
MGMKSILGEREVGFVPIFLCYYVVKDFGERKNTIYVMQKIGL